MQAKQGNFLQSLFWYIYKVSKKNQKKVKKNLVVSFFCRTFVADKENNRKTNN